MLHLDRTSELHNRSRSQRLLFRLPEFEQILNLTSSNILTSIPVYFDSAKDLLFNEPGTKEHLKMSFC